MINPAMSPVEYMWSVLLIVLLAVALILSALIIIYGFMILVTYHE